MTKAEDMYIISALHEIPILTKRIEKQKEDLTKYASSVSNFTPEFGSAEAQRKEVENCSSRRSTSSSARDGSSAASPSRTPSPKSK